jgi:hypothetical protein
MSYAFYPDLPPLPDLPLDAESSTFHQYLTINCDKDGIAIPNTVVTRHRINPDITEWAKQNISPELNYIGLQYCGVEGGGVSIPHTDRTRTWSLIWFLDTGGDNVRTVYWQERGFDIERPPGYYPKSYNDLTELESHVFETNRWVLINAKVIHSIENMTSIRKSIQLGFWDDSDFIKKFTTQ